MTDLDETLTKGENIATAAVEASKGENIAQITDLLVQLASISGTINVELFKSHTRKERAKADAEDAKTSATWADLGAGGTAAHAEVVGKVKAMAAVKLLRAADENYRYIKTFRDNYQVIIEVIRSRVSALKTEQKNL